MSGKTHDEENVDVGTPGVPGVLVGYIGDALATARSELGYCHGQQVRVPRETVFLGQPVECWLGGGHPDDEAVEAPASWGVVELELDRVGRFQMLWSQTFFGNTGKKIGDDVGLRALQCGLRHLRVRQWLQSPSS